MGTCQGCQLSLTLAPSLCFILKICINYSKKIWFKVNWKVFTINCGNPAFPHSLLKFGAKEERGCGGKKRNH